MTRFQMTRVIFRRGGGRGGLMIIEQFTKNYEQEKKAIWEPSDGM